MVKFIHTSVQLEQDQSDKLEEIARRLGYLLTRGVGAGRVGSISQLMQAIAKGEAIVSRKEQEGNNGNGRP